MTDRDFCKSIIQNDGICAAHLDGKGPWQRECSPSQCPIYQEIPCLPEYAVKKAYAWLAANPESEAAK